MGAGDADTRLAPTVNGVEPFVGNASDAIDIGVADGAGHEKIELFGQSIHDGLVVHLVEMLPENELLASVLQEIEHGGRQALLGGIQTACTIGHELLGDEENAVLFDLRICGVALAGRGEGRLEKVSPYLVGERSGFELGDDVPRIDGIVLLERNDFHLIVEKAHHGKNPFGLGVVLLFDILVGSDEDLDAIAFCEIASHDFMAEGRADDDILHNKKKFFSTCSCSLDRLHVGKICYSKYKPESDHNFPNSYT